MLTFVLDLQQDTYNVVAVLQHVFMLQHRTLRVHRPCQIYQPFECRPDEPAVAPIPSISSCIFPVSLTVSLGHILPPDTFCLQIISYVLNMTRFADCLGDDDKPGGLGELVVGAGGEYVLRQYALEGRQRLGMD